MAPVQAPVQMPQISQPRQIPQKVQIPNMPAANPASRILNSHLTLDAYSPVNQNGSFEFDRVLKSGCVMKRTRKTKVTSPPYLLSPLLTRLGVEVDLFSTPAKLSIDIQRSK